MMKKILFVLVSIMLLGGLFACNEFGLSFQGIKDIDYVIGNDAPDYLYGVYVKDREGNVYTTGIEVDDSNVDLETVGKYDIKYSFTMDTSTIRKTAKVNVTEGSGTGLIDKLNIYYLNDLHGSLVENTSSNQIGLSKIANLVRRKMVNESSSSVFIAGGDMLQGTAISNYYQGASTIELLNEMKLDCFVMGNHEFDWGLDTVLAYFDPESDTEIKANFPMLGANIVYKGTSTRPEFIDAYHIIERGGLKIGIIGTIGYGLESSIATAMVSEYEFLDPIGFVRDNAYHLRTVENCDIVLAVDHNASDYFNNAVGELTGDYYVDGCFNGHTHTEYVRYYNRTGVSMPIIQSASNGRYVGHVTFTINENKEVISYTAENRGRYDDAMQSEELHIAGIVKKYNDEVNLILGDPIITAGDNLSKDTLTHMMSEVIRLSVENAVVGFHNDGGTRFAINSGTVITMNTLYEVFPFDNDIKYCELQGRYIKILMVLDRNYSSTISSDNIDDDTWYLVAASSYIFDDETTEYGYFYHYGRNHGTTNEFMRDAFINSMLKLKENGVTHLYPNTTIVLNSINPNWNLLYVPSFKDYYLSI